MLQYNPSISGSLNITGSLIISNGMIGTVNGVDVQIFSSSINQVITGIQAATGSQEGRLGSIESFTSSTSARLNSIETISASNLSRLNSLEEKTGSLATTGSNTFYGQQVFSGSLYVQDNLIVQGSSSLQNITASAVSIGTNIVYLNTDTPAVRFAGLTVQDSGSSAGVTGSMLWDSLCNRWVYSNPSTIGYSGGMLLSGPRAATLGTETTLTCNYIAKSGGGDHLYDSCIYETGGCVGINTSSPYSTLTIGNSDDTAVITPGGNNTHLTIKTIGGGGAFRVYSVGGSTGNVATTESFRVSPNGNVGINAVSPNVKLEVCGTGLFTDNSVYVGGCGGQLRIVKNAASTPATMTIFGYDNLSVNQAAGAIDFDLQLTGTCGQTAASIRALNADANESSAHLAFYTATNTGVTRAGAASTERLRITCDGKIGINCSLPSDTLTIGGCQTGLSINSETTGDAYIRWRIDGTIKADSYVDRATDNFLIGPSVNSALILKTNSNERMRISGGGCITLCSNNLPLASISNFGYSGTYQVLILGNTNNGQTKNLAFGVDVSGNASGAFSGYGNEYIWRCAGSFITPNPANNGYNTIFNWNGGGCTWFSNALGVNITSPTSALHVKCANDVLRLETLCARGSGQLYMSYADPSGRKGYIGYGSGTSDLFVISNDMNAPVTIYTNDTKRVSIAGSGEVTFCCQICTPGISITSNPIGVEYLIIAGGGGGGWDVGGGGGAGGVLNGSTGIWPGTYILGIGGGGPGKSGGGGVSTSQNGYNTYAIGLTAIGGGGGGNYSGGHGSSGGSGGGGAGYGATTFAGFGMKGQGFEGGCGINVAGTQSTGGGGGGAGGIGPSSVNNLGGSTTGGVGIISTIIGEHRSYGCGGRGGGDSWSGPMNTGTANTGNGGDGAGVPNEGCAGGSGIVILKMKNSNSATFSGGLTTYTCTNVACYNIYVVTAGAGTVTIS